MGDLTCHSWKVDDYGGSGIRKTIGLIAPPGR